MPHEGQGIPRAIAHGFSKAKQWVFDYATDTVNIIRGAYLFVYLGLGLIAAPLLRSPRTAMVAFIVTAILSYIFGARVTLGAGGYKTFKRLLRGFGGMDPAKPNLLDVWYWQAFIAMWASAPLAALALFRPWEVGKTPELIFAIFMLLYVVATQREIGAFWRRVYATATVGVIGMVLFSIVMPGTYHELTARLGWNQACDEQTATTVDRKKGDDRWWIEQYNTDERDLLNRQRWNQRDPKGHAWTEADQAELDRIREARQNVGIDYDALVESSGCSPASESLWASTTEFPENHPGLTLILGLVLVAGMKGKSGHGGH